MSSAELELVSEDGFLCRRHADRLSLPFGSLILSRRREDRAPHPPTEPLRRRPWDPANLDGGCAQRKRSRVQILASTLRRRNRRPEETGVDTRGCTADLHREAG